MHSERYKTPHMIEEVIVCGIHDIIDTPPTDSTEEQKDQYIDMVTIKHRENGCPGPIFTARRRDMIISRESVGLW